MITIVDYGVGNVRSIANMLHKCGVRSLITSAPGDIESAEKIVLPGVGSFDCGVENLHRLGLFEVLDRRIRRREAVILGICLGMQLFSRRSEEGRLAGFGWIEADTIRFHIENGSPKLKVPHMGWNSVEPVAGSRLFVDLPDEKRFYFVHSYHVAPSDAGCIAAVSEYGARFVSAVEQDNILGVQFHPEKSHRFGMKVLKNFAEYY